jgi:hypothetical protein
MTSLLAKVAVSLGAKLITETFLSKLLIEGLRAWSAQTENSHDDRVVEAIAQALGVDPIKLKPGAPT